MLRQRPDIQVPVGLCEGAALPVDEALQAADCAQALVAGMLGHDAAVASSAAVGAGAASAHQLAFYADSSEEVSLSVVCH